MARLKEQYLKDVVPALVKKFEYSNPMAVPKIEKIVLNVGVGEATTNPRLLDTVAEELTAITGQKPIIKKAKKAIAGFRLRAGMPIATMVTLRRERMYEFLDRLICITLPRVRDFRGVSKTSFDGRGNYTLGIKDQLIFPELDAGKIDRIYGLNITIVTSAKTDEEARYLLGQMGMPYQRDEDESGLVAGGK